ncbi:MAG TPA: serine hydrolase [Hypericibacter adhaerens]|uniref:6-aminohexanoate-dimer hydrolase n=1 Tax=Hypericibacter adhaerens TaxID=2602016 RepID=A0A5J6N332_9PROT|nr:serine hydrolase [Hypericibacter adhaerens]QEX24149.1 6-aminohexanoate-dimer hydrolase [Hypericibacter adhaerens]HWA42294.1 serine hydrolase [Hypericibacter adhaerens]
MVPRHTKRITALNWDQPGNAAWSFRHIRRLFPTAPVGRGEGPVAPLPEALQDLDRLPLARDDGSAITLLEFLQASDTNGFIVLHRGHVVYERYFNGQAPEHAHLAMSVSKSVAGDLMGILVAEERIDPASLVTDYLPELKSTGYAGATVQHVLDMQTGVRFVEDYYDLDSDAFKIDIACGWKPPRSADDPVSLNDMIRAIKPERAHGEFFTYRSADTDLLGWLMETVTGMDLADLLADRLWSKLGTEHEAYYAVDKVGTPLADGGFCASLRDFARFGQMHLNQGLFNGRQIVPADWVRRTRRGDPAKFRAEPYKTQMPKGAYSHQWWVRDSHTGVQLARGIFGQMIYIDPPNEMVAVKLSTWPKPTLPPMVVETLRALDTIAAWVTQDG